VLFRIFRKFGSVSAFSPVFSCKAFALLVNSALDKTAGFFEANFPYIFQLCLARRAFPLPVCLYTLYIAVLAWNGFAPLFSQFSLHPTFAQKAPRFFGESAKTQNIVVYRLTYP
jgi:hypothetical protein